MPGAPVLKTPKNGVGPDFSRPHSKFALHGSVSRRALRQTVLNAWEFPFSGVPLLIRQFPVGEQALCSATDSRQLQICPRHSYIRNARRSPITGSHNFF